MDLKKQNEQTKMASSWSWKWKGCSIAWDKHRSTTVIFCLFFFLHLPLKASWLVKRPLVFRKRMLSSQSWFYCPCASSFIFCILVENQKWRWVKDGRVHATWDAMISIVFSLLSLVIISHSNHYNILLTSPTFTCPTPVPRLRYQANSITTLIAHSLIAFLCNTDRNHPCL